MMRNGLVKRMLVMMMIVVAPAGVVEAGSEKAPQDLAYVKAKEQLADLMASEAFDKVEFAADSFDQAMNLIYTTSETYLDRAISALGDVETARKFGIHVLQGLNDHTIHYADEGGYNLAGKGYLLIANEEDARNLGELLARVAILIHGADGWAGVDIRHAARRIFEGMFPVEGSGEPLVTQYLVRLRSLSASERKALLDFAVE